MSYDCIAFPESGDPVMIEVREDQQDVSFQVNGEWQSRRVGRYSVTSPGKEVVYLIAHGMDNKPSNETIRKAIEQLNPRSYEIN